MIAARLITLVGSIALLCSCSSQGTEGLPGAQALATLRGGSTELVPRFVPLAQKNAPALQIGFVETGISGVLLLEKRAGQFDFWLSPDGAQVILEGGLLHSTRGLGEGLLASRLAPSLRAIRSRQPAVVDRQVTYLNGNDEAVTRTFRCVVEPKGADEIALGGATVSVERVQESCVSLVERFTNLYWLAPGQNTILQSRQWAGPFLGDVSTRIVPKTRR